LFLPRLDALLARLSDVQRRSHGYVARCPAHQDHRPSLSIATGQDDKILLHCWSGCTPEAVLATLGFTWRDLFSDSRTPAIPRPKPVSEYNAILDDLMARERRLADRRARWRDVMEFAEEAKAVDRLIVSARALATKLGPDDERAWDLCDRAARLETMLANAESAPW
jgi:hypothetical protein